MNSHVETLTLPQVTRSWPRFSREVWMRRALIGLALIFFTAFLLLPLLAIFGQALAKGWAAYAQAIVHPEVLEALLLSLSIVACVVPLNTVFGLSAAWLLSKFRFRGRGLLLSLIDLPLSVSPVVAGLIFVLLFGRQGWWGPWLADYGVKIIFSFPGMLLATLFVTFPYVVRELLPLMEAQGCDAEEAALMLGASGWQSFLHVTLPRVRWALMHGMVLCGARALGEFGAVSVVSGHIRGMTNTLPLHVEILYNEYQFVAAFAVASLLGLCSLATLAGKHYLKSQADAMAKN